MSRVLDAYKGSNADNTKAVYAELAALGPAGVVAMNLLRACKASERAKLYRGGNGRGSYRQQAYEKKDWSIGQLVATLKEHAGGLGMRWGWGRDDKAVNFECVLYVDLPVGQVSFHNAKRHAGPPYPGEWDGVRGASTSRTIWYANELLGIKEPPPPVEGGFHARQDRTKGKGAARDARAEARDEGQQEAFNLGPAEQDGPHQADG